MRPLHPLRKVVLILYLQIRKKFRFGGPTLRDGDSVDLEWGTGICILTSLQVILTWGLWSTLWDMLHNPRAVVPGDTSHALLISGYPTRPASTLVMLAKCPCPDFTEEVYHPVPLHHSDTDPRQTEPKLMISLWLFLWERKLCWQTAGVLSCKIERIPLETENNLKSFWPQTFFFPRRMLRTSKVSNKGEATYTLYNWNIFRKLHKQYMYACYCKNFKPYEWR